MLSLACRITSSIVGSCSVAFAFPKTVKENTFERHPFLTFGSLNLEVDGGILRSRLWEFDPGQRVFQGKHKETGG